MKFSRFLKNFGFVLYFSLFLCAPSFAAEAFERTDTQLINEDGFDILDDSLCFKNTSPSTHDLDKYFNRLRLTINKLLQLISSIENQEEKERRIKSLKRICKMTINNFKKGDSEKHTIQHTQHIKSCDKFSSHCFSFFD